MAEANGDSNPEPEEVLQRAARSFILRVWLERSGRSPPVLRGTLADLGGHVLGAFGSVEALGRVIRESFLGNSQ